MKALVGETGKVSSPKDLRQNLTEQPSMMTLMFPGIQHPPLPVAVIPPLTVHHLTSSALSSPLGAEGLARLCALWRSRSWRGAGSDNCQRPAVTVTPFAEGQAG